MELTRFDLPWRKATDDDLIDAVIYFHDFYYKSVYCLRVFTAIICVLITGLSTIIFGMRWKAVPETDFLFLLIFCCLVGMICCTVVAITRVMASLREWNLLKAQLFRICDATVLRAENRMLNVAVGEDWAKIAVDQRDCWPSDDEKVRLVELCGRIFPMPMVVKKA